MTTSHTPTPWSMRPNPERAYHSWIDGPPDPSRSDQLIGFPVAEVQEQADNSQLWLRPPAAEVRESVKDGHPNAALIVRAVNAHVELVRALKQIVDAYDANSDFFGGGDPYCMISDARAALARARGE